MEDNKKIKTYITYFDDRQISEYGLEANEDTILFKGNDVSYSGDSINNLNTYYCELCTLYYVWKNNIKSDYVIFKQYRRSFDWKIADRLPSDGEVICYNPIAVSGTIIQQYAVCHGRKRATLLMDIIRDMYTSNSDVYRYFSRDNVLYTNNSMVLKWNDFTKMCDFVFGVLARIDKYFKLNYNPEKYKQNALEYTEDGRYDYQTHWVAYIGERLVSCYIRLYLNAITIPRLEGNGFFKPWHGTTKNI